MGRQPEQHHRRRRRVGAGEGGGQVRGMRERRGVEWVRVRVRVRVGVIWVAWPLVVAGVMLRVTASVAG